MGNKVGTGFVWHDDYARYASGMLGILERPHPAFEPLVTVDHPLPKSRMKNLIASTGLENHLQPIAPLAATREMLALCHDPAYVDRIVRMSAAEGGDGGVGAPFAHGGYEIAALSAGGVVAAVDAVMTGQVDNAYALVHPPGHHARPDSGMGYCLFANAPIAAMHARKRYGLRRVAILDWDVHHGNAAQEIFWRDPAVLAVSIHQAEAYPHSGAVHEIGDGNGLGYTLNVPLPAGAGEPAYLATMEEVVLPALYAYRPELILVSCGFDAGLCDPLGRMRLNAGSFSRLTSAICVAARELCEGKIVFAQEGGYDPSSVPFFGLATIETLSGISTGIDNPFSLPLSAAEPLRADERTAIDDARATMRSAIRRYGDT